MPKIVDANALDARLLCGVFQCSCDIRGGERIFAAEDECGILAAFFILGKYIT